MDTQHAVDVPPIDEIAADLLAAAEHYRETQRAKGKQPGRGQQLGTAEAAFAMGVSERTLQDWRLRGIGPRFVRISPRCVKYRPRELARYIAEREVGSTSEPTAASSSNPTHRAKLDKGGGRGRR